MINKAKEIVERYNDKQIIIAIEEMAELTQALTKYMRIMSNGQPVRKNLKDVLENIKEELADVQLMLLQMKMFFEIESKDLSKTMEEKLDRTLELMKTTEYEKLTYF